jgi:hypothetical protein
MSVLFANPEPAGYKTTATPISYGEWIPQKQVVWCIPYSFSSDLHELAALLFAGYQLHRHVDSLLILEGQKWKTSSWLHTAASCCWSARTTLAWAHGLWLLPFAESCLYA